MHDFFLNKAAQLAAAVDPHQTSPNPRVGCVVVRDQKIIVTGTHETLGGAHAEINALKNLKAEDLKTA